MNTPQPGPDYDVDIAIISDFRLPGGTTSSIAEEVQAQSDAGLRTALIHVASSVTNYALPWSRHIRRIVGLPHVALRTPGSRVRAKLIIVRHPTVLLSTRHRLQNISGDRVMIIANHAAIDAGGKQHYDIAAADAKLRDMFGAEPIWAPIGPVVRGTMLQQTRQIPFRETDWVNIFSLPDQIQARTGFLQDTPVIGRHSRPQPGKWPNTGRDILAAYPDDPAYTVRVLGGADVAEHLLGYVPANWEVIPFGGEDPAMFLRRIDFWVYMHHPDLKEAFGRAAMEALAAGCVAIMPPYMEELFGEAALYAKPHQVRDLVDEYHADLQKFLDQSRKAQEFAQRFSPQMHLERLRELGVNTDSAPAAQHPGQQDAAHRGAMIAIVDGRPCSERIAEYVSAAKQNPQLIIVTVDEEPWSQLPPAQAVLIPTAVRLNMDPAAWEALLARRISQLAEGIGPERISYEGMLPPPALTAVLQRAAAEKLWLRRRPDELTQGEPARATGAQQVEAEPYFHIISQAEKSSLAAAVGVERGDP